jgi:hypothetical protein
LAALNDDWEQKHGQALVAKDNEKQYALLEQAKQHAEAMKKKSSEKQNELDGLLVVLEKTRVALRDEKVGARFTGCFAFVYRALPRVWSPQRAHVSLRKRFPLDRIRCARLYMLCLYLNHKHVSTDAARVKEIELLKGQVISLEESVRRVSSAAPPWT